MNQRSRRSRRSACDRCRTYKLRCDRPPVQGAICERCKGLQIVCTTTIRRSAADMPNIVGALRSPPASFRSPTAPVNGRTTDGSSYPPILPGTRNQLTSQSNRCSNVDNHAMPDADLISNSPILTGESAFDFDFSDLAFSDHASTSAFDNSDKPMLQHISQCAEDQLELDTNDCADGRSPSFLADLENSCPIGSARGLFDLCAELVEEYNTSVTGSQSSSYSHCSNSLGTEVQRMLSATSKLSEIVEGIIALETTPSTQDCHTRRGTAEINSLQHSESQPVSRVDSTSIRATWPRRSPQDVLLRTSVVTTYMYLVRSWRRTFVYIHDQLLAPSPAEGDILKSLKLPGLQLGGFPVHNIPNIQVVVLMELTSSMMRTVEGCLGISTGLGTASGFAQSNGAVPDGRQALGMDPVSVSIREMLLSLESRRPVSGDHFGQLSLGDMMVEIRAQLNKQT